MSAAGKAIFSRIRQYRDGTGPAPKSMLGAMLMRIGRRSRPSSSVASSSTIEQTPAIEQTIPPESVTPPPVQTPPIAVPQDQYTATDNDTRAFLGYPSAQQNTNRVGSFWQNALRRRPFGGDGQQTPFGRRNPWLG